MDRKLKDLCLPGMIMEYQYGFEPATNLLIKVQAYRTGICKSESVTILSRNNPPEIRCCCCQKNLAQWIDPERYYEKDAFWCTECLIELSKKEAREDLEEDEVLDETDGGNFLDAYFLPVCNSPRTGICAYEGSEVYPEQFEPDKR